MIAALLACHLYFTPSDANLAYAKTADLVENFTPRNSGTIRGRLAANYIFDSLETLGAKPQFDKFSAKTPLGTRFFTNIRAEFPSTENREGDWIVIISHYDTKTAVSCPGANDGASTSGLLIALANIFAKNYSDDVNIELLWLDGEECMIAYRPNDGFWGSTEAARRLKRSGRNVSAVICLDMLGDKDLTISIPKNSSPHLREVALVAAKNAGYEKFIRESNEFIKDDHVQFMREGFPAIDLIDFQYGSSPGSNDYWHTNEDTIDKISKASLLKAGSIVLEMVYLLSN